MVLKAIQIITIVVLCFFIGNVSAQGTWLQKASVPERGDVGFSIGTKGYVGLAADSTGVANHFWEYDPSSDTWTRRADFPGAARSGSVGFSIGDKGYIGTGIDSAGIPITEFWEYNQTLNQWTRKTDFAGMRRTQAVGFSIGNKGYIGTGNSHSLPGLLKDFWEYNSATDLWSQKAELGGMDAEPRYGATGFSIGNKGYLGIGTPGGFNALDDFWEYDPAFDIWAEKAYFEGGQRSFAVGFSIGNKGYMGTGYTNPANDFWEYDTVTDVWLQIANVDTIWRQGAIGFSIGNKGYVGLGYNSPSISYLNDFWEYTPTLPNDVNESDKNNFQVHVSPNAFTNQLIFSLANNELTTISFYDFLGQQILQQTFTNSTTINTEQLAGGIYFYELRNSKGALETGKVVKQ